MPDPLEQRAYFEGILDEILANLESAADHLDRDDRPEADHLETIRSALDLLAVFPSIPKYGLLYE